jgi:hypothetical protein
MLGIIVAAALATATGADLTLSVDGYTYFHKRGSTLEVQETDTANCVQLAQTFWGPAESKPSFIGVGIEALGRKSLVAANIENCMVAKGWDVVRLPGARGSELAKLNRADLSNQISQMMSAPEPEGEVVRRWGNDAANASTKIFGSNRVGQKPSLSVMALGPAALAKKPDEALRILDVNQTSETSGVPAKTLAAIPPGDALILVRLTGKRVKRIWRFARVGDTPIKNKPAQPTDIFSPRAPIGLWSGSTKSSDSILAFAVPPGRWTLSSYGLFFNYWGVIVLIGVNFCYGTPAFDVGPGEIVFAGTFASEGPDVLPNLDLAPVEEALAGNPLFVGKVKAASYLNGVQPPCGRYSSGYALEMPGAPYVAGYQFGSKAQVQP